MAGENETSIRIPVSQALVRQVILGLALSVLPATSVGYVGSNVGGKLDKLAEGQKALEERFAKLEGARYDARIEALESQVSGLREHVAGLVGAQKEKQK